MSVVEVLHDPTPGEVRAALATVTGGVADHDLALAVTEVVANAREHGRPPVEVRVVTLGGTVEVVVHDAGPGPADRAAPLPPRTDATRGRGRWLAHHLVDVEERRLADGYAVRLRAASTGGATEGEG